MSEDSSRILAGASYRFGAEVLAKVASFALYVVMARKLGQAEFGVFTFAIAFVALVTTFANIGQDLILTREVARDRSRVDEYLADALATKLAAAVPALALAIVILTASGTTSRTRDTTILLGIAVLAELALNTCFAVFQAFERFALIGAGLAFQRLLTAVVGIAALLSGARVVAVAAVYAVSAFVALALALTLLYRRVASPRLTLEPRRWWPLLRAAFPLGAAGIFGIVLFRIDVAFLAAFKPQSVVGEYGAAYRLLEATFFVAWSVNTAVYPAFARLEPRSGEARLLLERGLKLLVAVTLPLALGAVVLARPVITLVYGERFEGAATAFALLGPAVVAYAVSYVSGYFLVAQDRALTWTAIYAVVAVENVVANLILIPRFSLEGAAFATMTSEALLAVAFVVFARRLLGGLDWRRMLAGPVVAGAPAAVVMLGLRTIPVAAVVAGAAVYLLALSLFERTVFPEDARVMTSFLRRRGSIVG